MSRLELKELSFERILARDTPVLRRALRHGSPNKKTLSLLSESVRELARRKSLGTANSLSVRSSNQHGVAGYRRGS